MLVWRQRGRGREKREVYGTQHMNRVNSLSLSLSLSLLSLSLSLPSSPSLPPSLSPPSLSLPLPRLCLDIQGQGGKKGSEQEVFKSSANRAKKRDHFFEELKKKGMEFEVQDPKVSLCVSDGAILTCGLQFYDGELYFVKCHATFRLLQKGAEELLIRMPIKVCLHTIHSFTLFCLKYSNPHPRAKGYSTLSCLVYARALLFNSK